MTLIPNKNLSILIWSVVILLVSACNNTPDQSSYHLDLESWKENRLADLKGPYGWTSVVGLYEIRKSIQYIGKSDTNEFQLKGKAPGYIGTILRADSLITFRPNRNTQVVVDENIIEEHIMLDDRHPDGPTLFSHDNLQWHLIERQDRTFLRVKDTLSQYRQALHEIPYFAVDTNYRVHARFVPSQTDTLYYNNVLDMEFSTPIVGHLEFRIYDVNHRLGAFAGADGHYFIIFSDETTGVSTYAGGRYIYPKYADTEGMTIIDFNQAVNPPCVFTPYATCPLPSLDNHMEQNINAGEKYIELY